ncbi:cytochrome c [Spirosoma sp. 209]|uniref:cytochrome c n=1 Tax=Spirosoma sp. 209 TaxID=1955701 RepID=UPI00098D0B6C|nr:cytochrome c [Spirosoma sp. 209]
MRKRIRKALTFLIVGLLVIVGAGLAFIRLGLPDVGPAPLLEIDSDAAQIERGRYLANHVAACMDCHSTRDFTKLTGPMVAGTEGKGGEGFLREQGFPGNYYAPNLTPAHLGTWTDGEIYRAITTGVSRDGRALFPVMPYQNFGQMAPDDIHAIIAYLRSLKPIQHVVPASESDFPMNFIINTIPAKREGGKRPAPTDQIAYGKYITTFAGCGDCHTPVDAQGQGLPGMSFAGGREFPMPTGTARAANITPAQSGIGKWTREAFIARFRAYTNASAQPTVGEEGTNSIMPWTMYAHMTDQDLGAIYDYLRTVKPVEHTVPPFTPKPRMVATR